MLFILAILAFLLDLWAVISMFETRVPNRVRFAWIAAIVAFPIAGFLVWLFAGPKCRAIFILPG